MSSRRKLIGETPISENPWSVTYDVLAEPLITEVRVTVDASPDPSVKPGISVDLLVSWRDDFHSRSGKLDLDTMGIKWSSRGAPSVPGYMRDPTKMAGGDQVMPIVNLALKRWMNKLV